MIMCAGGGKHKMETNQGPGVQKCAGPMRGNEFYQASGDQHTHKEIDIPHRDFS